MQSHATSAPSALLVRSAATRSYEFPPLNWIPGQVSIFNVIFVFSALKLVNVRYFIFRNVLPVALCSYRLNVRPLVF